MNRRNRTLSSSCSSVLVAGVASFFVYRAVQQIPVREVEVKSYYVAVAVEGRCRWARCWRPATSSWWPGRPSSPVAGGYSTVEEVVNRGLIAPVVENEPLTASKVASLEAGAGLPPTITAGMRAISVKVNEVIGVAGFVVPGTRVDVVVTLTRPRADSMSRVVVSNVQVLTAGTKYDQEQAKDGKPVPEHRGDAAGDAGGCRAHRAGARRRAQIMLTLRNPLDTRADRDQGHAHGVADGRARIRRRSTRVVKGVPARVRPPAPAPPPPPSDLFR